LTPRAAGFARPELVASTAWLADELNRAEIRVLDVRWRPDGTGAQAFEAGHIPGAVHVDWRTELNEVPGEEDGPALRLAGADQVAASMSHAGVGDGASVVIYDDSNGLYAARVWWTLRVYGFESVRVARRRVSLMEAREADRQHRLTPPPRRGLHAEAKPTPSADHRRRPRAPRLGRTPRSSTPAPCRSTAATRAARAGSAIFPGQ